VKPDASRTVYDGKQFRVDVERWGESERDVVVHPGAVAIVAVDREGAVTLVRQQREPARKHVLELPAGTLEEGEEPLETARRELAEETGLRGGKWREAARFYSSPGWANELVHLFFAEGVEAGDARPEANEDIELVRVAADALAARVEEIEDAKTLAGLLLYLRGR
jgi:ADP-ribose pyrophosphatase